jgi:phage recombination protein Bet
MATKPTEPKTIEYTPFGSKEKIKLSVQIVMDLVASPTKSGQKPSERDCMNFLMLCKTRQLNPFEGDCWLIGYDTKDGPKFNLVTAHQAFLKRAEVNPDYDGMQSGVICRSPEGQICEFEGDFFPEGLALLGGWATVWSKSRKYPTVRKLKLATFSKDTPVWRQNPEGQIVKCAEADALRSTYPTVLGGLYVAGELEEATPLNGNGEAKLLEHNHLPTANFRTRTEEATARLQPVAEVAPQAMPIDREPGVEDEDQ